MKLHKSFWLSWLLLFWMSFSSPACAAVPADSLANSPTDAQILHILNRLGFGPRPGDLEQVRSLGIDRYIAQQLDPSSLPLPQTLTEKLDAIAPLKLSTVELFEQYGPQAQMDSQSQRQTNLRPARSGMNSAQTAPMPVKDVISLTRMAAQSRLLRAINSPRQLEEVMVDFWYNHFNVFANKGLAFLWAGAYERDAIRPFVLGQFRDLLGATARHPAMLIYLDNWQNTAPNSPGARGNLRGLNENYARELMELHTLGVDGGYTQQDVITLAKIFTGWGFNRSVPGRVRYEFWFDERRHDFSDKVFLGQSIAGSGITEGEQALDMLSRSPKTARHISYKLAQYFVADQPPAALVDRLSQKFLETDGNIRAVLDTLFHSSEFWDEANFNAKFKTPYQFIVSIARVVDRAAINPARLQAWLSQVGMPLYGCSTPTGYSNLQADWLTSDAVLRRVNTVISLARGTSSLYNPALPGADTPAMPSAGPSARLAPPVDPESLQRTIGRLLSNKTTQTIASSPAPVQAALMLGSPEMMYR